MRLSNFGDGFEPSEGFDGYFGFDGGIMPPTS